MKIKDLKPNKKNPRKISDKKLGMLKASLAKFGDLSGFVYNRRSKQMVSGHQRTKTLPDDATIKIEHKYAEATKAMTVAEGYVLIDGEKFKYREVDASPEWEVEALLAANKHQGEWDTDLLKLNLADFPNLNLEIAGFELSELKAMKIDFNPQKIEMTDEEYIKENPGPESYQEKERLPDMINRGEKPVEEVGDVTTFGAVDEKTDIIGKRFIIIIDCKDDLAKSELKKKLQTIVDESGAKFF